MLTDTQCRKAKPREKAYKISDSKGLYLYVTPAGGKSWRWKYRIGTTEKRLVLGSYPDVSLERARDLRDDARTMKSEGLDPALERKALKARRQVEQATTFRSVAEAWHERQKPTWRPRHADAVLRQMKNDVFPAIGELPIRSVTSGHVLQLLKKVEERGAVDRAHRLRHFVSETFAFAIASGLADADPAAVVRSAL
jgi:hypothetical protein